LTPLPPLHVVGLGGTGRPGSTTERALVAALEAAARAGCSTQLVGAAGMPAELYDPGQPERSDAARTLVEALRRADGLLIATPSYHGGISGLVKNAIDFVEDTRDESRPYFEGRAVGCIVVADGPQALGSTLASLRAIVHALRGWPTPYAVTLNSRDRPFGDATSPPHGAALDACRRVAMQVVEFATMSRDARRSGAVSADPSATRPAERFP
jgi:FMN reductase